MAYFFSSSLWNALLLWPDVFILYDRLMFAAVSCCKGANVIKVQLNRPIIQHLHAGFCSSCHVHVNTTIALALHTKKKKFNV